MLEKLIIKHSPKILPILAATCLMLPGRINADETKKYIFLNAGYNVLGPNFSDSYNSGISYGAGAGRFDNGYGYEFGINFFNSNASSQSTSKRGLISGSQSSNSDRLGLTSINAALYLGTNNLSFGVRALAQNARLTKEYVASHYSIFSRSDSLTRNFVNETLFGGELFFRYNPKLSNDGMEVVFEGGIQKTKGVEHPDLKSELSYLKAQLNFPISKPPKKPRRR